MKDVYWGMARLAERLHRTFHELVRTEIEARGLRDLSAVQALLLQGVGDGSPTVGELTARGHYLGTNVTYNLKQLVQGDYITQTRSEHDRRATQIRLTDKGRAVAAIVEEIARAHCDGLAADGLREREMRSIGESLMRLDRYWTDRTRNAAHALG